MFICLPQGIQDVGDFVSSVEHKQRYLTQTVAVSHIMAVNGTHGFESQNNRNNRSVQETEQYLYHFLPLIHHNIQLSWACSQQPVHDAST